MTGALVLVAAGASVSQREFLREAAAVATDGLRASGHEVVLIDLHDFDPVMSAAERAAYSTDSPILDDAVRRHAELVGATRVLVVVYAAVMGTLPPELKGWLDRVLVPGVAFTMSSSGRAQRGLRHLDRIIGVAVYDEGRRSRRRRRRVDAGRRIIARNVRLRPCHDTSSVGEPRGRTDPAATGAIPVSRR